MRAPRRPRTRDDDGFSLVEVVVSMAVLSVLLIVFVQAVRIMTTTTTRVTATATNTPVYTGGNWYLEFSTDSVKAGDDQQCTQWRYQPSSRLLQYRTWSTVSLVSGAWVTVADAMANDPVTQPPFAVYPSDAAFTLPRVAVDVRLLTSAGSTVQTQGQYTLRNSADAAPPSPSTVCTQLGRP